MPIGSVDISFTVFCLYGSRDSTVTNFSAKDEAWNFARRFIDVKFLTVKRVELHHCAKFRRNRSNRRWDMAIFPRWWPCRRPPSWICNACVEAIHEGHLVVFITAKFGWNRCSCFDMHVFLISWVWLESAKIENCYFWGADPKWGAMRKKFLKRHIIARVGVVWAIMRVNPSRGLTCRWVPQKGYK